MNRPRAQFAARWIFRIVILCTLILPESPSAEPFVNIVDRLRNAIPPLDPHSRPPPSPEAEAYFRYYGIDAKDALHRFGFFDASGYRLAAHLFIPEHAKGTVFLMHGYLDHAGLMKHLIDLLLNLKFSVAVFDLPGHGLSSGQRAAIDDFSVYASVFDAFMKRFAPRLPRPHHLIGHSTGCAIAYEYVHRKADAPFARMIFLAPLVHSNHWQLTKAGFRMIDPFVDTIPRAFKENTSDPNYQAFLEADPLQSRRIPLSWVNALFAWAERIENDPKIDQAVCIIQGDRDTVVDWRYNISFLKEKLVPLCIKYIPGAKHQLINERIDLRSKAFREIRTCLQNVEALSP